jgi:hypothetical protein
MRGLPVRCWLNSGVSARAGLCASPPFDETVGERRYMNPSESYQFTNLHGNLENCGCCGMVNFIFNLTFSVDVSV